MAIYYGINGINYLGTRCYYKIIISRVRNVWHISHQPIVVYKIAIKKREINNKEKNESVYYNLSDVYKNSNKFYAFLLSTKCKKNWSIAVMAVINIAPYCTTPNCNVVKLKIAPLKRDRTERGERYMYSACSAHEPLNNIPFLIGVNMFCVFSI